MPSSPCLPAPHLASRNYRNPSTQNSHSRIPIPVLRDTVSDTRHYKLECIHRDAYDCLRRDCRA